MTPLATITLFAHENPKHPIHILPNLGSIRVQSYTEGRFQFTGDGGEIERELTWPVATLLDGVRKFTVMGPNGIAKDREFLRFLYREATNSHGASDLAAESTFLFKTLVYIPPPEDSAAPPFEIRVEFHLNSNKVFHSMGPPPVFAAQLTGCLNHNARDRTFFQTEEEREDAAASAAASAARAEAPRRTLTRAIQHLTPKLRRHRALSPPTHRLEGEPEEVAAEAASPRTSRFSALSRTFQHLSPTLRRRRSRTIPK